MQNINICRIAVFYDGTYFNKVSNYYGFHHERKSRLSVKGLNEFIISNAAIAEGIPKERCKIVESSFFKGVYSAQQANDLDKLYSDRAFEDTLIRAGVKLHHQLLMVRPDGILEEKRIDVSLALEAYEAASFKKCDLCVLITGDGDFIPLIRKLNMIGVRVMLLSWDFMYEHEGRTHRTCTASGLNEYANYAFAMDRHIEEHKNDPLVNGLFSYRNPEVAYTGAKGNSSATSPPAISTPKQKGTIISFNRERGFGFIKPQTGGENLFFHVSQVDSQNGELVEIGKTIEFQQEDSPRGGTAVAVCLV